MEVNKCNSILAPTQFACTCSGRLYRVVNSPIKVGEYYCNKCKELWVNSPLNQPIYDEEEVE